MVLKTTTNLKNKANYRTYHRYFALCLMIVFSFCQLATNNTANAATTDHITQFGITWTFDTNYTYGQFANGDYWVVGPVTIIGIDPCSTNVGGVIKNGSMLNPNYTGPPGFVEVKQGFDNRDGYKCYDANLNVALDVKASNPLVITPPSSLISTISLTTITSYPVLKTAAVLTVLNTVPPAGSFRPSYFGSDKTIKYNKSMLNYSKLASLVEPTPLHNYPPYHWPLHTDNPVDINNQDETVERMFERPWIDFRVQVPGYCIHPTDNMYWYAPTMALQVGIGALTLHLNYTNSQKETLLIRFVQLGIDDYGILSRGLRIWGGSGHGLGRKWPITFAGIMLNDPNMFVHNGDGGYWGEDDQTFYVTQSDIYSEPYPIRSSQDGLGFSAGTVTVTKGSKIVSGSGTSWTNAFIGSYIGVDGDEVRAYYPGNYGGYLITNVNQASQTLILQTLYILRAWARGYALFGFY